MQNIVLIFLLAIFFAILGTLLAEWVISLHIRYLQKSLRQVRDLQAAAQAGVPYSQLLAMPMPRKLRRQLIAKLGKPRAES